MRIINYMAITIVVIFATSCGGKSTKEGETPVDTAGTTTTATTTTTTSSESFVAPDPIRTSFQEKYPNTQNATWSRYQPTDYIDWDWAGWPSMDTADYAVTFKMDNSDYWAWYDDQNNWVGTVSTMTDYKGLPEAVNKSVQKEFNGYTITGVDKEFDRNRTAYEIDLMKGEDKGRLLVAEDGTVIKKKAVTDGEKTKEKMPESK